MKSPSRKRPVNLTLSESLVNQARGMTDNLSGVVEQLLAEFIAREQRDKLARSEAAEKTVALWNKFNANNGSIADEYSTL
ncbi:MAG TPA: type II toxin-antitoxin system CcdA family antitoxin [Steroidobacteraceae bacterium]|nr:type II toxin-antitoxin system CcdA family antitoxin [Steroidobacteraceae bacterium]